MTKISQLSSIGDSLAIGDQFLIRDIDDTGSPNKSVTVSGITRALDLGTAAAPAIAFASDKNTGIYSPGADQVAVATNGTGRLYIDASGNIGVGTPSDGKRVFIYGDGTSTAALGVVNPSSTNGAFLYLGDSFGDAAIKTIPAASTTSLAFFVAGANTERLRITSAGLVGIGTSSPTELLNVNGNIALDTVALNAPKFLQFKANSDGTGTPSYGGITWYNYQWDATKRAEISSGPDGGVAAGYLAFSTGSTGVTERLRISASGNVGIGTSSPDARLEVAAPTAGRSYTSSVLDFSNIHLDGATPDTTTSALTFASGGGGGAAVAFSRGSSSDTQISFWTNPAVGANTATQRMVIDSSGRLLVATSTPRSISSAFMGGGGATADFQVEGQYLAVGCFSSNRNDNFGPYLAFVKSRGATANSFTLVNNGDVIGALSFNGTDGSAALAGAAITAFVDGTPGANDMPGRLVFSTTADGASSPTERMRITNGGNVLFNATAVVEQGLVLISYNGGVNQGAIFAESDTTSGNTAIRFKVAGSTVGSITTTSAATAYNTSSDYRIKENITAVSDGITRLQQLKPSRFNFIADPDHTVDGFIAHEAQAVVPECVTGTKDEVDADGNPVYQGIDQSKLVPLLTAALQEAIGEIESLKARLTAAGL